MAKPVLGKSVHSDWFFPGRDFAVQTFSMVEMVEAVYFRFGAKLANSKFATKTAKKKGILSLFIANLPELKLKRLKFYQVSKMDVKETNILRASSISSWRSGNFWCRKWNRYHESQEAIIDDFINQQKSSNTNKNTATDMNTLLTLLC